MSMIQLIGIGAATFILILLIIALVVTRRRERARAAAAAPPRPVTPARPGSAPPAGSVLDGAPRDDLYRLRGEKPGEPEEPEAHPTIIPSAASAPSAAERFAAVEPTHEAGVLHATAEETLAAETPDATAGRASEAGETDAAPDEAHEAVPSAPGAPPPSAALWAGVAAADADVADRDLWGGPVAGGSDTTAEQTDRAPVIEPAFDTDTAVVEPAAWEDEEGAELEPVVHGAQALTDDPWSSSPAPDEPSVDERARESAEDARDAGAGRQPDAAAEAWPPGLYEPTPNDVGQPPVAGAAEEAVVIGAEGVDTGDSPRSAFASQPGAAGTLDTPPSRHDEVVRDDTVIWTPAAGVSAGPSEPAPRDEVLETAGPTADAADKTRPAEEHTPQPAAAASAADEAPPLAAGPDRPVGMSDAAATAVGAAGAEAERREPRLVRLCDIISTTNSQHVDLNDPDVRRMLRELVQSEVDLAQQYKQLGQNIDAVLQLTEAQKICRALSMDSHAKLLEQMIRELQV
jgi:hypothetical protein